MAVEHGRETFWRTRYTQRPLMRGHVRGVRLSPARPEISGPMTFYHCRHRRSFALAVVIVCSRPGLPELENFVRAEDSAPPAFQPAEISIGEPFPLPERRFPAQPPAPEPDATPPRGSVAVSAAGNGWIGLTVDDKVVTGRLVVVDVAAAGPAARSGIKRDDQLLAIDAWRAPFDGLAA